mmetsp:Transcript_6972/g.12745  ORF Transcript_6972/g.12745 Transcript_6972/m.12745 type:complete len:171 (+) Transcript_6972:969-1481(+)
MGVVTGIVYSALLLLVTLLFFCRKKKTQPVEEPVTQKPRDLRPIITLNGTALLGFPVAKSKLLVLQDLTQRFRVYIPIQATDEVQEKELMLQLSEVMPGYRVLFYKTELGYMSMVRQLNPRVHMESSRDLALEMRRYLETIIVVSESQCEGFLQVICLEDAPAFLRSLEL